MKPLPGCALQRHCLESVLPHSPHGPQQFLKTRQFFRPEAFIWNNPHRASDQMYSFYHSYNDRFARSREPAIRLQEEQDREEAERQRIHRLIAFRTKARQELAQRQSCRQALEERARKGNAAAHAVRSETGAPWGRHQSQTSIDDGQPQEAGTGLRPQQSERAVRRGGSSSLARQGGTREINKMLKERAEDYQSRIRCEFAARRQRNGASSIRLRVKRGQVEGQAGGQ